MPTDTTPGAGPTSLDCAPCPLFGPVDAPVRPGAVGRRGVAVGRRGLMAKPSTHGNCAINPRQRSPTPTHGTARDDFPHAQREDYTLFLHNQGTSGGPGRKHHHFSRGP